MYFKLPLKAKQELQGSPHFYDRTFCPLWYCQLWYFAYLHPILAVRLTCNEKKIQIHCKIISQLFIKSVMLWRHARGYPTADTLEDIPLTTPLPTTWGCPNTSCTALRVCKEDTSGWVFKATSNERKWGLTSESPGITFSISAVMEFCRGKEGMVEYWSSSDRQSWQFFYTRSSDE